MIFWVCLCTEVCVPIYQSMFGHSQVTTLQQKKRAEEERERKKTPLNHKETVPSFCIYTIQPKQLYGSEQSHHTNMTMKLFWKFHFHQIAQNKFTRKKCYRHFTWYDKYKWEMRSEKPCISGELPSHVRVFVYENRLFSGSSIRWRELGLSHGYIVTLIRLIDVVLRGV